MISQDENSWQWEQPVQRPHAWNQCGKFREQKAAGGTRAQREERVEELTSGPGEEGKWGWHPAQTTVLPS